MHKMVVIYRWSYKQIEINDNFILETPILTIYGVDCYHSTGGLEMLPVLFLCGELLHRVVM